ncbi:MAG TPA: quinol:electron acceptor oxidoreductase subunit ActD [Anaeromyxobacteraceae bacterium]|jgi:molybdopterin-containing oxidoreductase family membrane subunit|nr:quinol:electron acceptor oxidoreductase subunit ActD [Anaeromyxobacteraceae bacterium]
MTPEQGVLGTFVRPGDAARAVRALKAKGHRDVRVAMPAPFPEVVAAVGKPRSFVDYITLPGALAGLVGGLLLTILTSLAWRLVTGGKPIVSLPPFVVITFELTVLIGSLANLVALGFGIGRGGRPKHFPVHERFNGDVIGVFAAGGDPGSVEEVLRESGAEEVTRVG